MYAIMGEDDSDVDMLFTLVRRIANDPKMKILRKGFDGGGELIKKGARQVQLFKKLGCNKFIICYDSDKARPSDRYVDIISKIVKESGVAGEFCALVPVQEIESWILADMDAVNIVIPSLRSEKKIVSPELQNDPKEHLYRLSRGANSKPLYIHAMHNPKIAAYLNLKTLANKCPSSLPLFELVQGGVGNHPLPKYPAHADRTQAVLDKLVN